MFNHAESGNTVFERSRKLKSVIEAGNISFAGNRQLKIYGTLTCQSGKRMKAANRVFFVSPKEATQNGYRPCGHCIKTDYQNWKNGLV